MSGVSAGRLAAAFVDVADTLVEDFDLMDFLDTVTTHTANLLGAAEVGLMVTDERGDLAYVAGSQELANSLELFQLQSSEGPCLDAYRSGVRVSSSRLADEPHRWPSFGPRALAAGFASVHALPMRLRHQVIGAMNVFGEQEHGVDEEDLLIAGALADVATVALVQERTLERATTLAQQLQTALTSRVTIEQAKGALAQLHGTDVDQAFQTLRSYARSHQLKLTEVAAACLNEPDRYPELTNPTAPVRQVP